MRICTRCGDPKPDDLFYKGKVECKECAGRRQKAYSRSRRADLYALVNEVKSDPCSDCGACYPPYVMEFDHVSDDKVACVATLVANRSRWAVIKAEIAKCELVCSNCHAIRTHDRLADRKAVQAVA